MKKIVLPAVALLAFFLGGCSNTKELVIYNTSDVRGYYWPNPAPEGERGGYAVLKNMLKTETSKYILLGGGNWFYDTPEGKFTKDTAAVRLMNDLGYAAVCPGGSDFSYGWKPLRAMISKANFPVLCANVYYGAGERRADFFKPYFITELGGVKTGIFGLMSRSVYKNVQSMEMSGITVTDPVAEAERVVPELRKKGCKLIIALTDMGFNAYRRGAEDDDGELARRVPGISLIIGGGTRPESERPEKIGDTYIVQAGSKLEKAGRLSLSVNVYSGKIIRCRYRLISVEKSKYGEDIEIAEYLARIRGEVVRLLDKKVAYSKDSYAHAGGGETPMGDWMADCMRRWLKADIALLNYSAIKNGLPSGSLTERALYDTIPGDDSVMSMKVRGEDIKSALEAGLSSPAGRIQISGLSVRYNMGAAEGERVKGILVDGEPLKNDKIYRVVATDTMIAGAEGYGALGRAVEFANTKELLRTRISWCLYVRQPREKEAPVRWLEDKN
ncbi:MAG: 5'-nucleotidase C-terminal domain-containing protein [Elusimicrobiaceae bacterium]